MNFYQKLCEILGQGFVKEQEPMKKHTTFRVGGPADYFLMPQTLEQLQSVLEALREAEIHYYVVGNGSNLLVGDKGYRGAILHLGKVQTEIQIRGDQVTAGSGMLLARLANKVYEESLTGFEFAAGIPGSLGGAVVMNAGAYGSEMSNVLISADVIGEDGRIRTLSTEALELGYRTSCIQKNNYIVLNAVLQLQKGNQADIKVYMQDLSGRRRSKQPLEYPSAGSTFKRPEGYFAGKLIQDSGLLGFRVGDAMISEKHCGFVINKGNASATDILTLCSKVSEKVYEQYQIHLEMEIRKIGDF